MKLRGRKKFERIGLAQEKRHMNGGERSEHLSLDEQTSLWFSSGESYMIDGGERSEHSTMDERSEYGFAPRK